MELLREFWQFYAPFAELFAYLLGVVTVCCIAAWGWVQLEKLTESPELDALDDLRDAQVENDNAHEQYAQTVVEQETRSSRFARNRKAA